MGRKVLKNRQAYFCKTCNSLCEFYEQGLACNCGPHYETEVYDKAKYPAKWIPVYVEVYIWAE